MCSRKANLYWALLAAASALLWGCGDDDRGGSTGTMSMADAGATASDSGSQAGTDKDASEGTESDASSTTDLDAGQTGGDTWDSYAMGFFVTYCVSCHNRGGMTSRDYDMLAEVQRDAARIRCGVSPEEIDGCGSGFPSPSQFPIGTGPYPDDDERRRLVAWLDSGAN